MATDPEQNAAFYDELAAHYDSHLTSPHDVLARAAFRDLVARHVAPGSTLLDFGCGTGLDALAYAHQGYRVLAYDNSAGMVAELKRRCRNEIAAGTILPCSGDYAAFLNRWPVWPAPNATVADFAVLNSIRDLQPLFERFAERLAPPGWVIVSILNPIHWTKLKESGWWLRALQARGEPALYLTRPYVSYLHFVRNLLRAAPQFHLTGRANAGGLVRYDETWPAKKQLWWGKEGSQAGRGSRALWNTPAHKLLGHFVFLVLRRDG
jgi:SAM-dependent methyltransferase